MPDRGTDDDKSALEKLLCHSAGGAKRSYPTVFEKIGKKQLNNEILPFLDLSELEVTFRAMQ